VHPEHERAPAEAGDRVEDERTDDGAQRRRQQRGYEPSVPFATWKPAKGRTISDGIGGNTVSTAMTTASPAYPASTTASSMVPVRSASMLANPGWRRCMRNS